jgi:putative transposase
MKSFTEPMEPEKFYHIYNRVINGCDIFLGEYNYRKFLEKYALHTNNILTTYAYCLLKNHFHLFS